VTPLNMWVTSMEHDTTTARCHIHIVKFTFSLEVKDQPIKSRKYLLISWLWFGQGVDTRY
jgi:hypothetical protein